MNPIRNLHIDQSSFFATHCVLLSLTQNTLSNKFLTV